MIEREVEKIRENLRGEFSASRKNVQRKTLSFSSFSFRSRQRTTKQRCRNAIQPIGNDVKPNRRTFQGTSSDFRRISSFQRDDRTSGAKSRKNPTEFRTKREKEENDREIRFDLNFSVDFQKAIENSNIVKQQVEAKLIPLKNETDSINKISSSALADIRKIKSQADIHVHRIEKASEIGKNLTNEINSARDQVNKLLEQVKSLQSSLS